MAFDTAFYLVTKDIAIRSGLVDVRYRTLDGRFILDNKDLSRVRFTTDEYINGLDGVEKITEDEAQTLIANGGYKKGIGFVNRGIGIPTGDSEEPVVESEETESEETQEPAESDNGDNEEKETVETNEKGEEE